MKAIRKYLAGHAADDIVLAHRLRDHYAHVLVVPVCAEQASFVDGFEAAAAGASGRVLAIIVVNAPESASADTHAQNAALIRDIEDKTPGFDVLVIDRASPKKRLLGKGGVGLARKIGCDVALALFAGGKVESPWIHTTDADATLPEGYFRAVSEGGYAVALTYPFIHTAAPDTDTGRAHLVYELSLRTYVLGLSRAGSPYAFHTLGSAMAARADAYAAVRGIPPRTGGEDFYFLQKLRKLGRVARAHTDPIRIACRQSPRVPFGTGPAVARISATHAGGEIHRILDPRCFSLLERWLTLIDEVAEARNPVLAFERVAAWQKSTGPESWLAAAAEASGALAAITRDHRQAHTPESYKKRLTDGFDGLRTLRLIHEITATALPRIPWPEAIHQTPELAAIAHLADPDDPQKLARLCRALLDFESDANR